MMSKVSIKGVVIGGVVDVVATNILAFPLVLYIMARIGTASAPTPVEIMSALRADPILHSIQAALGIACSILGGYVAARIAKSHEMLNGALSSFLCVLIGLYDLASSVTLGSAPEHALLIAVSISAATFGGFLARKPQRIGAT
jgi:hypothetical protein